MKGTSDIAFDPNVNTTIGVSVTVLYNMTDKPDIETDDIAWYAKSRAGAMENGIINRKIRINKQRPL